MKGFQEVATKAKFKTLPRASDGSSMSNLRKRSEEKVSCPLKNKKPTDIYTHAYTHIYVKEGKKR